MRRRRLIPGLSLLCLLLSLNFASAQSPVYDDFNRPDNTSLGTATTGQTWSTHVGSIGIEDGQAAPGSGFFLASVDTGSTSLNVEFTLNQPAVEFWMLLRFADDQNYWRFGRWQGQSYTLQQVQLNSLGTPSIEAGAEILAQAGDRISCKVRPALIDCRVNGVAVARSTESFAASATRVGVSGYNAGSARLDDLVASVPSLPDLAVTMAGPSVIYEGGDGVWLATVNNVGVAPISADALIVPPTTVSNVNIVGASCVAEGSAWRCFLGAIGVGEESIVEIHATAPDSLTALEFSATVEGSSDEDDLTNNSSSVTTETRQPPPPGAIVFDPFDRPDGPAGQTYSGHSWTAYAGSLNIADGQAAPGDGFVLAAVDTGQSGGDFTVTVVTPSTEFWTILRLSDGANYWRFGRWKGEGYQLQRIRAQGATIYPPLVNVLPAAGDVLRCVYWFDEIECSVNGVLAARVFDSFNQTASRVGFSTYIAPTTRFDQLLVKPPPPRVDVNVAITGPVMIRSGETGNWSITLLNQGSSVVSGAEVIVTPPVQLTGAGVAGASCSLEAAHYRCAIGALSTGVATTITLTGIAPSAPAMLSMSAVTAAQPGEDQVSDNTASASTHVRRAIPVDARVVDLFDRPDSLTMGMADTGQLWTNHSSVAGIQSHEMAVSSGVTTLDAGVTSGDISATVLTISNEFWLIVRFSDGQNYWRFGRWQNGPYQLQQIRANQLGTPALQILGTVQPAVGDQIACRVGTLGLDCAVNDVTVVRTQDTFNRSATRIGFASYTSPPMRFDDLVMIHMPTGPDLGVSVQAPSVTLKDLQYTVHVDVRNNGDSTAFGATLNLSLPSVEVVAAPAACVLSPQIQCNLGSSQSVGGFERFTLTLSAATPGLISASADALVAGEAYAPDNHASWTTAVETSESAIVDNFARADTTGGLGSALTGQPWLPIAGGFGIANSEARASGAGSLTAIDAGFAFGTLEVVMGSSPALGGIAFRIVDANNYYRLSTDGGFYRLTKVVNGVVQELDFYLWRHLVAAQPGDRVRVVSRPDDSLFVTVNGLHIIDAGDVQFMFETRWGLLAVSGTPSFRSFSLRPVAEGLATQDTFSGPNGNWLSSPTTGVNYHWVPWIGANWIYDNGTARSQSDAYSLTVLDTSSERATTKATLVQPGSGAWIIFRYLESGPYFRFGHEGGAYGVDYRSGYFPLEMPAPVEQLATISPAAGDVLEVRQSADGKVECFVNGILTHRFHDATNGFRSTLNGMAAEDSSAAFDNFEVTPLPH
jgi:hypothetical protein